MLSHFDFYYIGFSGMFVVFVGVLGCLSFGGQKTGREGEGELNEGFVDSLPLSFDVSLCMRQ